VRPVRGKRSFAAKLACNSAIEDFLSAKIFNPTNPTISARCGREERRSGRGSTTLKAKNSLLLWTSSVCPNLDKTSQQSVFRRGLSEAEEPVFNGLRGPTFRGVRLRWQGCPGTGAPAGHLQWWRMGLLCIFGQGEMNDYWCTERD